MSKSTVWYTKKKKKKVTEVCDYVSENLYSFECLLCSYKLALERFSSTRKVFCYHWRSSWKSCQPTYPISLKYFQISMGFHLVPWLFPFSSSSKHLLPQSSQFFEQTYSYYPQLGYSICSNILYYFH